MALCLLVDDSSTQRKIMCKLAQGCGLEIEEAENGLKAVEFCENTMPDMIILDMNMPEMDGIGFLNALDDIPKDFSPHIIVCSADIDTDLIVKAVKAGADEYHCKSMDINNLRQKIAAYSG